MSNGQSWSSLNDQFFDLYNKNEFGKAIVVGEKAKLAAQKEFGEMHLTYATTIYNLASVYLEEENYKKAEPLLLQAKAIQQKLLGDMHVDYASTITDLATLYVETKQYTKAEPLYLQAIKITEKTTGKNDPEYITVIENLATLYDEMHQYEKAKPLYEEVVAFYKIHPGKEKSDYITTLGNLAELYDKLNEPRPALEAYLVLADLNKNQTGAETKEYTRALNRAALLYTALGEYEKAGPLYFENAALRKIVYGEDHPDYASALNNIAAHYIDLGQYEKALPYYQEAIDIAEGYIKDGNTDYITYVNNFALLYMQMGQYDIAEPLFVRLVEVRKKMSGENDPSYATALNNLAVIYFKTGQYTKAIPVYANALAVIKRTFGEQSTEYASSLNNLGLLYATMEQYAKAEPLYLQSKTIREKLGAQSHPDYAALLDNLGLLYSNTGRSEKARLLYLLSMQTREKIFGKDHPDYAISLNNLAYYYMDMKRYDSAELLFNQAKTIIKEKLGETHPSYGTVLNNLADLYMRMGKFDKAEPGLLRSSKIIQDGIRKTFTVLSESEKNNYLATSAQQFETHHSFIYRYRQASSAVLTDNFNLQLVLKSASLAATRNMIEMLESSADSNTRAKFTAWRTNRNVLSKQYSLPAMDRRKDVEEIEAQTESQEKELNLLSSDFRGQETLLAINTVDVQKNMAADEVAIEFVRFKLSATDADSVMYAAYILHKDNPVPEFVPLCEEKQLQQLFDTAAKTKSSMVANFYRGLEGRGKTPAMAGRDLYKLIWQPMEPFLKGVKVVSYSPAGKLYAIAFHALPADSTSILADRYQLHQYISTRQIALRTKTNPSPTASISLFGDASFSMDSIQLARQKQTRAMSSIATKTAELGAKTSRGGVWIDLPGTAAEVTKINQLFIESGRKTQLFVKEEASEENLKKIANNTSTLVHIATHGFFLPDPATLKPGRINMGNNFDRSPNPLLRSGLVLAGGNYAWSGKKPIDGIEDGIVTAYEISQLNLSSKDLVVLSACETALGDVKGSEGVFGLQRAFKIAGVKKIIVSLWQVPDRETAELMTSFYGYYLNGQTIEDAFAHAQADMRQKYSAYYWAAFVMIE